MSHRKSSTPKTDPSKSNSSSTCSVYQSLSGSSKANRSNASFQFYKCGQCSVELINKDRQKHTELVCKSFAELTKQQQLGDGLDFKTANIFDIPALVSREFLYTNSVVNINKDKSSKMDDNVIFMSPELIQHCNINVADGRFVSVLDLDNDCAHKGYFLIQQHDQMKSCLSIGFLKDSVYAKKDLLDCPTYRVCFNTTAVDLQFVHLQINRKFVDPIFYLNSCSSIKKNLIRKVIYESGEFTVQINDNEFKLEVKQMKNSESLTTQTTEQKLEDKLGNLSISGSKPALIYKVSDNTEVVFTPQIPLFLNKNNYKMVGYSDQIELLEKLVIKPIQDKMLLLLPRTILLTGPSGTGKTLAINRIFEQAYGQLNLITIHCSLFLSKSFEFEKLRTAFKSLSCLRPSVLFLDNLEDISSDKNQIEKRLVSWLKLLLDELPKKDHVVVIGATSKPEQLDTSLRRPGRFDIEIEFPIPSPSDRRLILKQILSNYEHSLSDDQIDLLTEGAHGFTGADLKHLCELSLLRSMEKNNSSSGHCLSYDLLSQTLYRSKPSIMREITLEKPNVRWTDIGGLHDLRQLLEESVVWPIKHPEAFVRMGIEPPRGILMYGPPGCCKTMIGKALATESGLNFFSIKGPELFSKWVGESERAIREIFRKARSAAPSILFFDEIDALAAERGQQNSAVGDRVLAQLLTEIDGVEKLSQVVIVAATNRPDIVDKALLRPGRLDSMVYVPLPDLEARREIFDIRIRGMPLQGERKPQIELLAEQSEGYTGAEISAICQRAGLIALSEDLQNDCVTKEHFRLAFERVRPRISPETIAFYDEFSRRRTATAIN